MANWDYVIALERLKDLAKKYRAEASPSPDVITSRIRELRALDYDWKQKELLRKAFPEAADVRRRRRWRGQ